MKIKKELILAVFTTFCLTAALFIIVPTKSQSGNYDAWIDLNDDGSIDMADISIEIDNFMTTGTPIDKTALLLELQNKITALEERVLVLESLHGYQGPFPQPGWYNGLIGYWKFDEGTGTIAGDSSGNNNDGTLQNGTLWVDGKYGKALGFDGIDDCVIVPQSSSLDITDSVSVMAWVYRTSSPANGIVLSRWYDGSDPDRGIVLLLSDVTYFFNVIDDKNHLNVPFSFGINQWYFLAATWDGSVSRAYVNGIEIGNRTTSGSFTNQNIDLGIGSDLLPFANQFNGTIDDVMIYNRALTATEVLAHYTYAPP